MIRPCNGLRSCLLLLGLLLPEISRAVETLRVLAWPGYAEPEIVRQFEQRTQSKVEVTLVDSDDVLWQKVSRNGGSDYDVFAVNTAELQRYIGKELVVPIQTSSLSNLSRQIPPFNDLNGLPGLVSDGKVFAIPYTFAEMGLIFDRKQIQSPPDSITALWDSRFRGKVLAYNDGTHNFSLAAMALKKSTPFALRDTDWAAAVEKLIALRSNVLTFYTSPAESVELFVTRKAAMLLANYGSQQMKLLRAAGADVGYVIPKEGSLAWLDCWAITRGAQNKALAEAWINYLLEPVPGEMLQKRQGLANTTSPPRDRDPGAKLIWLEPVENTERRIRLWERIFSGDRQSKVLAP